MAYLPSLFLQLQGNETAVATPGETTAADFDSVQSLFPVILFT